MDTSAGSGGTVFDGRAHGDLQLIKSPTVRANRTRIAIALKLVREELAGCGVTGKGYYPTDAVGKPFPHARAQ
jgi:hypothetical protein